MRQEIFCRNNGGLEKLIPGAFTVFATPPTHPRVLSFLLNASAFFHVPHRLFAAFFRP